jgi:2-polyprenyl-3-methyl-5-hydroxy-6-metoxy-1,4-benzoquinol methylase
MDKQNTVSRPCPCCGSHAAKEQLTWSYQKENQLHRLGKCLSCGMVFVTNNHEIDMSNKAFIDWLPDTDKDIMTPAKLAYNRAVLHYISKYIPPNASILDYGAGYCGFLRIAKQEGYEVEGINPCKYLAEWAKNKFDINIEPVFGQDYEPGKQYDFILSDQTFEHLEEPKKDLMKLHSLLKPGGIAYINVPNYLTYRRLSHGVDCLKDIMHYNYFTTKTLKNICADCGFHIIKVAPTVGSNTPKKWVKSILNNLGIGDCSVLIKK